MAFGIARNIPSNTHQQIPIQSGTPVGALAILNPNDGVLFVARDNDVTSVNINAWDWKIPSQSYALLPGPFRTAGMFYLDQSGAGRAGDITCYPIVNHKVEFPVFQAIGRALTAIETTLDITEGTAPPAPGIGVLRLYADGTNNLHSLTSGGIDRTFATLEGNETFSGGKVFSTQTTFNSGVRILGGAPPLTLVGGIGGLAATIAWTDQAAGLTTLFHNTVGGAPGSCVLQFAIANGSVSGQTTALTLDGNGKVTVGTGGLLVNASGAVINGNSSVVGTFSVSGAVSFTNGLTVTGLPLMLAGQSGGFSTTIGWGEAGAGLNALEGNTVGGVPTACALRFRIATGAPGIGAIAFTMYGNGQVQIGTRGAFAAGDKYLICDAAGNVHQSAIGPAS